MVNFAFYCKINLLNVLCGRSNMKDELLENILKAEAKAENIITEAQKQAEEILSTAELDFENKKANLIEENKKQFKKEMAKREKKLQESNQKALQELQEKMDGVLLNSSGEKQAIKIILSEVNKQ